MSEQTQEGKLLRRNTRAMSHAEMLEILEHLVEIFDLPPCLMSLEINWRVGEALVVSCKSLPVSRSRPQIPQEPWYAP